MNDRLTKRPTDLIAVEIGQIRNQEIDEGHE
jgi:hypothetical protein